MLCYFLLRDEKENDVLYFAYGSNLWHEQMTTRCLGHRNLGTGCIRGWRWIITIRGYASIVPSEEDYVLGTVYELTEDDVLRLDCFEGVGKGCYRKEMMTVDMGGKDLNCLVYIDMVDAEGQPKQEYISRVNNGIQDSGFPEEYVERYLRKFVPGHTPVTFP
jgi:gamma-glutamylcyclotransferase (GGCT)/AIG2-like uncharacterized protein YtfP